MQVRLAGVDTEKSQQVGLEVVSVVVEQIQQRRNRTEPGIRAGLVLGQRGDAARVGHAVRQLDHVAAGPHRWALIAEQDAHSAGRLLSFDVVERPAFDREWNRDL